MKSYFRFARSLSPFKAFEIEVLKYPEWQYFDLHLAFSRKRDHAGFQFDLEVLGLGLNFSLHDKRHWNYEKDRYYQEGEEAQEERKNFVSGN